MKDDILNRIREVTIVVRFESHDPPAWIWESHMRKLITHGVFVKTIGEGDHINPFREDDDH